MKTKETMPDLSSLSAGARAGLEALRQPMSELKLARHDEWGLVFFGSPWVVRGRPEGARLTLEVQPERPQELRQELFTHWQPQSNGVWTFALTGPDTVRQALPLIQAVHHQAQIGALGHSARVEGFVAALREAFYELGPDIVVKKTKTTEQCWRGDVEIARVRVNKDTACLMLRHAFATLDNPGRVGEGFTGNRPDWPQKHFEAYLGDAEEVELLKPLLRQTYEQNGRR